MRRNGVFHLNRIDLESTHIDNITLPSFQMNKPLRIYVAKVRAVNFPVTEYSGSGLRVVHISAHQSLSGNHNMPVFRHFKH